MKIKANIVRLAASVLTVLAVLTASVGVFAARDLSAAEDIASSLRDAGLFKGTQNGFELDRPATRQEALLMLIRLLGLEDEASACTEECPFTDVSAWWKPYIAYAYKMGYTTGSVFDTEKGIYLFGTGTADAKMYCTFVLRALGYSDRNGDFSYSAAVDFARSVGIIPQEADTADFLRADVVYVSYAALSAEVSGGGTLGEKLGVFSPAEDDVSETDEDDETDTDDGGTYGIEPFSGTISPSDIDELYDMLNAAMDSCPDEIRLVPVGELDLLDAHTLLELSVECACSYCSWISCSYAAGTNDMKLTPEYADCSVAAAYALGRYERRLTAAQRELLGAAEELCASFEGLSPYDTVLAIHDTIAGNTRYSAAGGERAHTAAGVLIDGAGVCDGYSRAFWLLCRMCGIDCIRVIGIADGVDHAWNKVCLDGEWYNVDVTWDDPIYHYNGVLTDIIEYDYFLVSDNSIGESHIPCEHLNLPPAPRSYAK